MGEGIRKNCSPALWAAQQRLLSLREQHRACCQQVKSPPVSDGRNQLPPSNTDEEIRRLPDHLGWGSASLTKALHLRQIRQTSEGRARPFEPQPHQTEIEEQGQQPEPAIQPGSANNRPVVKLYPDIALGMLKQGQEAAGRIWLLLQYSDQAGRGWVDCQEARDLLTDKASPLRVCGRRQFRKLLVRGEGLYWRRNNGRLWLRSVPKVAFGLRVYRLKGHPVALPVTELLQGIGHVRAHLYASFHSNRNEKNKRQQAGKPISRAKLQQISHVSGRCQRRYEKRACVTNQSNFAIGQRVTAEDHQEQAWRRGRAIFTFVDRVGKMGEKGVSYTAWQLPNNYRGPHKPLPKGRQKRMNRELADLFMKGMTGNGRKWVQEDQTDDRRRFYDRGQPAAVKYNRSPEEDIFWRSRLGHAGHFHLWHVLPAQAMSKGPSS